MSDSISARVRRQLPTLGYWSTASYLVGAAAVVSAAAHAPPWFTIIFAAAVVAIEFYQRRDESAMSGTSADSYVGSRYLLLSAAVLLSVTQYPSGRTATLVGAAVAAVLFAAEPLLSRLQSRADVPCVAHVAGIPERSAPHFDYRVIIVADVLLLAAVFVAGFGVAWSGIVVTIVAVIAAAVLVSCAVDVLDRLRARVSVERRIGQILDAQHPWFAVHWDGPANAVYQIAMWLPYLDRLGVPYVIVVRSADNFRDVEGMTDRPVVLRRFMRELDSVVSPSLRAVFYVNTATSNQHMVRFARLTHIQLNHGDSDKAPSSSRLLRIYDKNFVAGQAAIDRFAANGISTRPDFCTIVGRPQVEAVQVAAPRRSDGGPVALYAPTWAGFSEDVCYSSLPVGLDVVRGLLDRGCEVVFRPHPYTRESEELSEACRQICDELARDAESTGRKHLFGPTAEKLMSIVDCFNASDVMVTDVSSVVDDYLYSEKPFAMVAMTADADRFAETFPVSRASYVLEVKSGRVTNLPDVLDELLVTDSRSSARASLKAHYLGESYEGGPARRFIDAARTELGLTREDAEHRSGQASDALG